MNNKKVPKLSNFRDFLGDSALKNNNFSQIFSSKEGPIETLINIMNNEPLYIILYSSLDLFLIILWLNNPWPFNENTFTKYPGGIRLFVILYVIITLLYHLFLKTKKQFSLENTSNVALWTSSNFFGN